MKYNISFITGSPLVATYYTCCTSVCVCVCRAEEFGDALSSGQGLPWGLWYVAHPARHFLSLTTQDHTPSNGLTLLSQALIET